MGGCLRIGRRRVFGLGGFVSMGKRGLWKFCEENEKKMEKSWGVYMEGMRNFYLGNDWLVDCLGIIWVLFGHRFEDTGQFWRKIRPRETQGQVGGL